MRIKTVLLATAAMFVTGGAHAADIYAAPAAAAAPAYTATAPFNWSGMYIGGVVGTGLFDTTNTMDDVENYSYTGFQSTDWGFTAGLTAGANWQFGAGVLGIEGDINWTDFSAEEHNEDWDSFYTSDWNWFATIRARAGLAVDRALIYATGGVAFVDAEYSLDYTDCDDCRTSTGGSEVGLAVGAGAEYAVTDNASVKLEYLFIGLPSEEVGTIFDEEDRVGFESHAHIVRAGLNWRFNMFGKGAPY